jgi:hypothetical protein
VLGLFLQSDTFDITAVSFRRFFPLFGVILAEIFSLIERLSID